MTFPAWDSFDARSRNPPTVIRLYRQLRRTLDFCEPRERTIDALEREFDEQDEPMDRADISRGLQWLVQQGFLIEHERGNGTGRARRYTLAFSLNPALKRAVA